MKKQLRKTFSILAWPIGGLLLAALMWSLLLTRLQEWETEIEMHALQEARAQSKSYAEQLARSIQQIDHISLHLKYYWTYTQGNLSVEDQQKQGLYPTSSLLYVTISDRDGNLKTSSLPLQNVSIANRNYFATLKHQPQAGLLISDPDIGIRTKKKLIRFSRRINASDGAFDGIVTVAIEPNFLAPLQDQSLIGANDFIVLLKKEGMPLVMRAGDAIQTQQNVFRSLPALNADNGAMIVPGTSFTDGQERIIAWQNLHDYPLRAVVGLSTDEVYATFRERSADYRVIAIICSIFLALCALVGMVLSMRLAMRKRETEKVREAYGIVTEGGTDGFYIWRAVRNKDGNIVDFDILDCNERGAAFFNTTKAELTGKRMSACLTANFFEQLMPTLQRAIKLGFYEDEYLTPSASPLPGVWVQRKMVRTKLGLAITLRDISDAKAHELALLQQLHTDDLTKLHNRHWVMGYLNDLLSIAAQRHNSAAILCLDLDDFKNVNDMLGHASGDLLLQSVAMRLREIAGGAYEIVRFSGDSFVVIQYPIDGSGCAALLAERILRGFSTPFTLDNQNTLQVSISVGISLFPRDGDSVDALLKHADIAMHAAKSEGKKCFRFYEIAFSERLQRKLENETALRQAIERDEFILHFQPRADAMSGKFCSMEALVRWQHPTRGLVPPLEFIPVVEETGMIIKLGALIIRKACAQLAQWKNAGLPALPLSVNVSSQQLNQGNLDSIITTALDHHGLDPSQLEIELTESCMMADTVEIAKELAAFQKMGIKLLVDDFGTGYSSLSQLQCLDLDVLKVDKAFTAALCGNSQGEIFFNAIVSMAHALKMTVVAEGVETKEQLYLLQSLGCDEVQGYFISRPVPAAEIPALMRKVYLFPETIASA